MTEGRLVDVTSALAQLEAAVSQQIALAGHDPAIESAAEALLGSLSPLLRQLATGLAEQAAAEVRAQLPGHQVDVVLQDGEPSLSVRPSDDAPPRLVTDDLEARLTLRLPGALKGLLEEAASESGDSINSYVVKALASRAAAARSKVGTQFRGVIET